MVVLQLWTTALVANVEMGAAAVRVADSDGQRAETLLVEELQAAEGPPPQANDERPGCWLEAARVTQAPLSSCPASTARSFWVCSR